METGKFFPRRGVGIKALIRQSFQSFFSMGGPTTAAAIAYFTLISFFPAFLLLVALGDTFIKIHGLSREAAERIISLLPSGTHHFILTNLDTMISSPSLGSIITYASIFIWAGMWVFHIVEEALDKAWRVEKSHSFWKSKITNFIMIFISSFFIVGSTILLATLHLIRSWLLPPWVPFSRLIFQFILAGSSYIMTVILLSLIYKIIPNTKVFLTEALSGGLIASAIWHVANIIFVWTIPYFHYEQLYGSIWALVVIVVWIYVSCWIMLIGAHFTYHIHRFSEN